MTSKHLSPIHICEQITSSKLFRFTLTKCSEQTVDIDILPEIICFAGNIAPVSYRRFIYDLTAVKVVLKSIGVVHLIEPRAIICKL